MRNVNIKPDTASIEANRTKLEWRKEGEEWVLRVLGRTGGGHWEPLARETHMTGYRAFLFGPVSWRERVYRIPSWVEPEAEQNAGLKWSWKQEIGGNPVHMETSFTADEAGRIRGRVSWELTKDHLRPHFGYGVSVKREKEIDNYCWLESPSQAAFYDETLGITFWMISTYNHSAGISKYDGCQALAVNKPTGEELQINVKLPPGYTDFDSKNLLKAGEKVTLHYAFLVGGGTYYDTIEQVLKVQPLEALGPRYSYRKHVDMVITALRDSRKWHAEGEGIINYGVVRGDPWKKYFVIDQDREGPGWSGCWDLEMIYTLSQYRKLYADERTKRFIDEHSKKMLKGWIRNPRFRIAEDISWRQPRDMKDSCIAAVRIQGPVRQEEEQDIIWTCHNAYMIYYLSKISTLTGDMEYRSHALPVAEWFFRMQSDDGSVPSLWIFENGKARVAREFQPASCLYMVSALIELYGMVGDERYRLSALELADYACPFLEETVPHWGQGELDFLYFDAHAIDPTGVAYIIWAYADAFELTQDERYWQLVDKFSISCGV